MIVDANHNDDDRIGKQIGNGNGNKGQRRVVCRVGMPVCVYGVEKNRNQKEIEDG